MEKTLVYLRQFWRFTLWQEGGSKYNSTLRLYSDDSEQDPSKFISLERSKIQVRMYGERMYTFRLITSNGRIHYLQVRTVVKFHLTWTSPLLGTKFGWARGLGPTSFGVWNHSKSCRIGSTVSSICRKTESAATSLWMYPISPSLQLQ